MVVVTKLKRYIEHITDLCCSLELKNFPSSQFGFISVSVEGTQSLRLQTLLITHNRRLMSLSILRCMTRVFLSHCCLLS